MLTPKQFAILVAGAIPKHSDRYTQIFHIKRIINLTPQKKLSTDRETIDEILDILFKEHGFQP